jgi:hypothetical protein
VGLTGEEDPDSILDFGRVEVVIDDQTWTFFEDRQVKPIHDPTGPVPIPAGEVCTNCKGTGLDPEGCGENDCRECMGRGFINPNAKTEGKS